MIGRVIAICILVLGLHTGAQAQSKAELALKIERLEREMIAMENRLRGGTGQPGTEGSAGGDRALLADLAAKLGTVERQMRTLTGRLEEIEFQQRQQADAIELLRKELSLYQQEASMRMSGQAATAALPSADVATAPGAQSETAEPVVAPAPEIALPEGDAAAQYQYAFNFIQKNDLDSGFTAMDLFLKAHPEDALAGNAKFWLGRIHRLKGRMPQAAQQLLALIEEHPNHPKRPDALLDLADALLALDSAPDACNALAEFRRSSDKASDRLKARAERTAQEAKCDN